MDSKLRELIEAAIEKTDRSSLVWTAFDSESFRAKIEPGHLHILRSQFIDDANDSTGVVYVVQVSDAQGRVVFEDEAEDKAVQEGESFVFLDRLFQVARKSALGSDRVIEDMLRTLRGGAYFSSTVVPPTAT